MQRIGGGSARIRRTEDIDIHDQRVAGERDTPIVARIRKRPGSVLWLHGNRFQPRKIACAPAIVPVEIEVDGVAMRADIARYESIVVASARRDHSPSEVIAGIGGRAAQGG